MWQGLFFILLLASATGDSGVANAGVECWEACDKISGACTFCGSGKCCRRGWPSNGCLPDEGGLNNHVCIADENECLTDNGGCAQICTNTMGSHVCSCKFGYKLIANGASCDDIDECALGTHNCPANAICSNIEGAFVCLCNAGYSPVYGATVLRSVAGDHGCGLEHL